MAEMPTSSCSSDLVRERAIEHLSPLFSNPTKAKQHLRELPVISSEAAQVGWAWLAVPDWASWVVPEKYGALLVPMYSDSLTYEEYPWWRAINSFIDLESEKSREARFPRLHSYANAQGRGSAPAFEFAWVNRIAAFLKAWSARRLGRTVEDIFGASPVPRVTLTHDVDAVEMTGVLKIKQAVSRASSGDIPGAFRILIAKREQTFLERLLKLESDLGFKSVWLLYCKPDKFSDGKRHILDPEYSIDHPRVSWLISELTEAHHVIGLHSSFYSWKDKGLLAKEREILAQRLDHAPVDIRQHWLRFGVGTTWIAQSQAGFTRDFTLGFNDRAGFRASSALPIGAADQDFSAIPTVVMDSNLFGWGLRRMNLRKMVIDHFLDEVAAFGGHVAINWHPHTLGPAYGWLGTFEYLLHAIRARRLDVVT